MTCLVCFEDRVFDLVCFKDKRVLSGLLYKSKSSKCSIWSVLWILLLCLVCFTELSVLSGLFYGSKSGLLCGSVFCLVSFTDQCSAKSALQSYVFCLVCFIDQGLSALSGLQSYAFCLVCFMQQSVLSGLLYRAKCSVWSALQT